MNLKNDLDRFYELMDALAARTGGPLRLDECHGDLEWPERGVYFLFEPGEYRANNHRFFRRVVHVGTTTSRNRKLWSRIGDIQGYADGGGKHRDATLRSLVGRALLTSNPSFERLEHWNRTNKELSDKLSNMRESIIESEDSHERRVSDYVGSMWFLAVNVSEKFDRVEIKKNIIALLSNGCNPADPPSDTWLGLSCHDERISGSGLWQRDFVYNSCESNLLNQFASCVDSTDSLFSD